MTRFAEIFTPAARGKITRAVYRTGKWNGRRGRIPVRITRKQADLFSANAIAWRAQLHGEWCNGDAGTVVEALEAIEKKAAEKRSE